MRILQPLILAFCPRFTHAVGNLRERCPLMVNLHDIRYVRVGTTDLDSAIRFATEIVGLQLVAREGKAAYFRSDKVTTRGDTRDHTMVYFEGDPADQAIGFDLHDPAMLDAVGAELENAGHQVH